MERSLVQQGIAGFLKGCITELVFLLTSEEGFTEKCKMNLE